MYCYRSSLLPVNENGVSSFEGTTDEDFEDCGFDQDSGAYQCDFGMFDVLLDLFLFILLILLRYAIPLQCIFSAPAPS